MESIGGKSDDEEEGSLDKHGAGHLLDIAKWLRKQAKCRSDQTSLEEIQERLRNLSPEEATLVVQDSNKNGKGALHFASQIRGGEADAPELIRLLVSLRADIDASIKRGHTALIFACSRGHSVVADLLLDLGANPLVVTVCGESAAKVGRGRIAVKVQDRLDAAEAAAPPSAWRDFRDVPDAQEAENLWEANAAKRGKRLRLAAQEQAVKDVAEQRLTTELFVAFEQALDTKKCDIVIQALVKLTGDCDMDWAISDRSLRSAIGKIIQTSDEQKLLSLLIIFREKELESALHASKDRNRRPICAILRALVDAVNAPESVQPMSCVPISKIARSAEPYMAMELLLASSPQTWIHADSLESLVDELIGERAHYARVPEVLSISCQKLLEHHSVNLHAQVGKIAKKNALVLAEWLRILSFASLILVATPHWKRLVHFVAVAAVAKRLSTLLTRVARAGIISLSDDVVQALSASLQDVGEESDVLAHIALPGFQRKDIAKYPLYELANDPEWIDEEEQFFALRRELEHMAKVCVAAGQPLSVAVDTEWACDDMASRSESVIAVLQIAAGKRVWVVDCLRRSVGLLLLIEWLRDSDYIQILGFAFTNDAVKLQDLLAVHTHGTGRFGTKMLDIQELAMRHLPLGQTPGLKVVSEIWLGRTLDKSHQCSDWSRRPLFNAQLSYAAADAAVLLDLAIAMGIEQDLETICGS